MKKLEPWEEFPDIWKNKVAFFTWLRSGLRKSIWQFYPPKLKFKNSQGYKPSADYKGKAKRLVKCSLTGEEVAISKAEIDHIIGNVSLKDWQDVLPFIMHLCASGDNMAVVSKEAHKIKSHAERKGISFEEALIEKRCIAIMKAKQDLQFITDHGIIAASNATKRRAQVMEILRKESA